MTDETHSLHEKPKHSDDQDHKLTEEQLLDESLEDSMDASDPPASTQPGGPGDYIPKDDPAKK